MQARYREYLALCALAVLATFIVLTFDYLPIRSLMADNADVLFAEEIGRALNAGGDLFDWRLSQVTYLFPDILFARVLAALGVGVGHVAAAFQILFGACLAALIFAAARSCRVRAAAPLSMAALLYSSAFVGNSIVNPIAVHFGLIGEHSGMLLAVLPALLCFLQLMQGEWQRRRLAAACFGLFASVFLGVISDSLAAIITLPPMAIFLSHAWRTCPHERERTKVIGWTIGLAVLAGKLFSFINPFPQDREYLHQIRARLPDAILPSIKTFVSDLFHYGTHSPLAGALLILTISGYAACIGSLRRRGVNGPVALMALTVVTGLPLVIGLQVGLGIYDSIALARHWAPMVFLTVVLGTMVAIADRPRIAEGTSLLVIIMAIGLSAELGREMRKQIGHVRPTPLFADLVACMQRDGRPGWLYISDYWISRPVRLYSNERFGAVPFVGESVLSTQADVRAIRRAHPEYLITGYSIAADPFVARFGQPRAVICNVIAAGQQVKILDFSNSEAFKAYARSKSEAAD
jgi:hypothetical protein